MSLTFSQLYKEVTWLQRDRSYFLDSLSDMDFRATRVTPSLLVNLAVENYYNPTPTPEVPHE